ncbi:MAG: site-2 protease family protein [Acutalibacteraceae bacterium]|nr:site-2 protease family protein [Acutalibacteraceae bacterium]
MLDLLFSRETDIFVWISYILSVAVVIFLSTPIHECAHAVTAVKLGDNTPKYMGRTTLNPFAHIDNIGALLILLFGFGWAKPVQVNSYNFKSPKKDMALTAIAGPISNIVVGLVFYIILKAMGNMYISLTSFLYYVIIFLQFIVQINVSLAVFNLIPIPPLDGSKLLAAVLPDRIYYNLMQYERYFSFILILLIVTDVLNYPISFLYKAIYSFFELITFWI